MQAGNLADTSAVLSFEEQCTRQLRRPRAGDAIGTVVLRVWEELTRLKFACPTRYYLQHQAVGQGALCHVKMDIGDRFADPRARNYKLYAELSILELSDTEAVIRFHLQVTQFSFVLGAPKADELALIARELAVPKPTLADSFVEFVTKLRDDNDDLVLQFRTELLEAIAP